MLLVIGATAGVLCLALLAAASEPEISWHVLEWEGLRRTYGVYVPTEPAEPAPLVVLLHGGGGSAATAWEQEHGRSWRALAEEHGFVLLLPEGRSDPSDPEAHHWNDCRADVENADVNSSEDDVGFILAALDATAGGLAIDPSRVFATGSSNGGMMTFRLAIEATQTFAAAAAVTANLPDPSECSLPAESMPIPILIMNGTDDPLMPYDGGCDSGSPCDRGRVMSTTETVSFWVDLNGASREPTVQRIPNRAWFDGSTVTVYRHAGSDNGADVVYYEIEGGGHMVPGTEWSSALLREIAGRKNRDIDGPTEIWAFFDEQG